MGISPRDFEQMKARVGGTRLRPQSVIPPTEWKSRSRHRVVLGIDPSLRGTGWGVVRVVPGGAEAIGMGTLTCPAGWLRTQCLLRIANGLREAIRQHSPEACAIEGLFHAQNLQTALLMGEARGVCLMVVAEAGLEVCEIAPRKVKQAIVGFGGAQKLAVARMVQRRLNLPQIPQADAADALAIALTHLQETSGFDLNGRQRL
jgi:crossover junction endodeoxyribonuclease RuvC